LIRYGILRGDVCLLFLLVCGVALPIILLSLGVFLSSVIRLIERQASCSLLLSSGLLATTRAAVALSVITAPAETEPLVAATTFNANENDGCGHGAKCAALPTGPA
jgi:hypothetical protein